MAGIDEKVAGRYRLIAVIGDGGMGRVWRAHDELLDRLVAVKEMRLSDGLTLDERRAAQQLTVREARSAARLDHPGVVRVFDVVWTPGRSWIVMEYVPSRSLHEVVAQDGPLTHREAARVGLVLLGALRAAHAAGVLHHDVKPQNVLIAFDGRVVLTDFGLATVGATPDAPRGDTLMGSPRYIAPERVRHGVSSERTDLWSLGATLYAAVEGRPPFERASTEASLAALRSDDPDPPRRPGPLHPLIAGLLTRDPVARTTGAQARTELDALLRPAVGVVVVPPASRPAVGVVVVPPPRRAADDGIRFASAAVAGPAPRRRPGRIRRPLLALVATAGVGVLVAGAVLLGRGGGAAPVSAPAASTPALTICSPETGRPLAGPSGTAPMAVPAGWQWQADPSGVALPVPRGWTRSTADGAVCFADPDGSRAFVVTAGRAGSGDPLREWQTAERAALAGGSLPGYRRVSMGVLLVSGGGADWEYSWEPVPGTRLHTHRVLLAAGSGRPYRLTWTTRDEDWTAGLAAQRTLLGGFRDLVAPASPWSVPRP